MVKKAIVNGGAHANKATAIRCDKGGEATHDTRKQYNGQHIIGAAPTTHADPQHVPIAEAVAAWALWEAP